MPPYGAPTVMLALTASWGNLPFSHGTTYGSTAVRVAVPTALVIAAFRGLGNKVFDPLCWKGLGNLNKEQEQKNVY